MKLFPAQQNAIKLFERFAGQFGGGLQFFRFENRGGFAHA
jgi:hypothetical protein